MELFLQHNEFFLIFKQSTILTKFSNLKFFVTSTNERAVPQQVLFIPFLVPRLARSNRRN